MSEALVKHCTIKIVKRGGWSWGSEPRRLVENAIQVLPELVLRKISAFIPHDEEISIQKPVSIHIPVRWRDLFSIINSGGRYSLAADTFKKGELERQVETAVRQNFADILEKPTENLFNNRHLHNQLIAGEKANKGLQDRQPLAELLINYHRRGKLTDFLNTLSLANLEFIHNALIPEIEYTTDGPSDFEYKNALSSMRKIVKAVNTNSNNRFFCLKERVEAVIHAADTLHLPHDSPKIISALNNLIPLTAQNRIKPKKNLEQSSLSKGLSNHPSANEMVDGNTKKALTLADLLMDHHRKGKLDTFLKLQSAADLENLNNAIIPEFRDDTVDQSELMRDKTFRLINKLVKDEYINLNDRSSRLKERLKTAMYAADRLHLPPDSFQIISALNIIMPAKTPNLDRQPGSVSLRPAPFEQRASPSQEISQYTISIDDQTRGTIPNPKPLTQLQSRLEPIVDADTYVASALPFLLLGPLSQIGYLDAVEAMFDAAGLLNDLPGFATALAFKVLDPPEKGWHHNAPSRNAAKVFAGVADEVPSPALAKLAKNASAILSVLDAVIARSLIDGGNASEALILFKTDDAGGEGLLLVDVEGIFPIGWKPRIQELTTLILECNRKAILIGQESADPEILALLDQHQIHFITDAPPIRGEKWRPIRSFGALNCWTNDFKTAEESLARFGYQIEDTKDIVSVMWHSFAVERPCVPLASTFELDGSLNIAVSVALGTIAWILWRKQETVNPLLALERFGDLDARVRFSPESIRVRLPLGRRFMDLKDHGLLEDIPNVPWFGARRVEFSGG
jgi:hypothetical protein